MKLVAGWLGRWLAESPSPPYRLPAVPAFGALDRYLGWINDETSLTIV